MDASIPFSPLLEQMIGTWTSEGEPALIIERVAEDIVIKNPDNEVWRFEITDARIDGETIKFTQRNFLKSGDPHPFNGVACRCEIHPADSDPNSLVYSMTTDSALEADSEILRRYEQP